MDALMHRKERISLSNAVKRNMVCVGSGVIIGIGIASVIYNKAVCRSYLVVNDYLLAVRLGYLVKRP